MKNQRTVAGNGRSLQGCCPVALAADDIPPGQSPGKSDINLILQGAGDPA
ncbi:hypothetical protein [Methanoculleus sp. UBA303]|jgi:hypothetical protein|nr:hypothetical protein [Methanoculleus sp. UBA303]MDD3932524.1 hypothetical protein [Methanoculleus sp.]